jgi:peptide subunit release factor 1 (eRF1)
MVMIPASLYVRNAALVAPLQICPITASTFPDTSFVATLAAISVTLMDKKDVVDDLAELAELSNTEVEIISGETEEGQMLKNAFGGIAAILRFKMQG